MMKLIGNSRVVEDPAPQLQILRVNHCSARGIVGMNDKFETVYEERLLDISRLLAGLKLKHLDMRGNKFQESSKFIKQERNIREGK